MAGPVRVLGLCGSLRKGSFNRMALRVAEALVPDGMMLAAHEIGAIPLYNADVEKEGLPAPVKALREALAAADAVLFVTPEYNHSLSGVLKNAIDWASRPPDQPFDGKPCAMMGASPGLLGTVRAQLHLRHVCIYLNMFPLNRPQVFITHADKKFDAEGNLTDEMARKLIRELLVALGDWTRKLRPHS
jgi:chromate reductase